MADLYTKYREENPINPEPSEFRDIVESEVKLALRFGFGEGFDIGWNKGFARAKELWAYKKLKMHIDKKEDGYLLIIDVPTGSAMVKLPDCSPGFVQLVIDEAVRLGAEAPQRREVAQATGSEAIEETTPSGATDPKSEVAQ